MMITKECGQCGKEVNHDKRARYYFEDDTWVCCDCFANVEYRDIPIQMNPAGEQRRLRKNRRGR